MVTQVRETFRSRTGPTGRSAGESRQSVSRPGMQVEASGRDFPCRHMDRR